MTGARLQIRTEEHARLSGRVVTELTCLLTMALPESAW